jgi:hypothetical protein
MIKVPADLKVPLTAVVHFTQSNMGDNYAHVIVNIYTERNEKPYGLDSRHPLDDIQISCQMDDHKVEEGYQAHSYGHSVEFRNLYSVDLQKAISMGKVLSTVNVGLGKLVEQWGYAQTYGQYVLRVLKVLGVRRMLVAPTAEGRDSSQYLVYDKVSEGCDTIDNFIARKFTNWNTSKWTTERY